MKVRFLAVVAVIGVAFWVYASAGDNAVDAERKRLLDLRRQGPDAVLAALKETDPEAWYRELVIAAGNDPATWGSVLRAENERRDAEAEVKAMVQRKVEETRLRSEQARACVDKSAGYAIAQEAVAKRLVAPSTARFPQIADVAFHFDGRDDPCRMKLGGMVEADNRFGVPLRLQWTVILVQNADRRSWRVDDVTLVER